MPRLRQQEQCREAEGESYFTTPNTVALDNSIGSHHPEIQFLRKDRESSGKSYKNIFECLITVMPSERP